MAEVQQTLDQTLETKKQEAFDYVKLQLGEGIIDTELDASHYESIYQRTIGTYRQRAENAFEESYNFLTLTEDTNIYTLPQEIQSVRQVFRRTIGFSNGDPTPTSDRGFATSLLATLVADRGSAN